jgi:alpha-N-arabinofuranosidase
VSGIEEAWTLSDPDPHAANTIDRQDRVRLRPNARAEVADGALRVTLPPVSWTAVSLR